MSLVEQEPFELRATARVLAGTVVVQIGTTGDAATLEDAADALEGLAKTVEKLRTRIVNERGDLTFVTWKRAPAVAAPAQGGGA